MFNIEDDYEGVQNDSNDIAASGPHLYKDQSQLGYIIEIKFNPYI